MKSVAYIRVSSEEQVQGTSLDSQRAACIKYASDNGIELPLDNIFREEGVSATLINRPELAALLDYCAKHKGEITHCIVWKVDRLARKAEYHQIIKSQLKKLGIKLVSVTEPIDESPMGTLMDTMLSGFAEFDNEIRKARTVGGMVARLEQGGWPHGAPVGYKRSRTAGSVVSVEPNEDAPKVKKFLEEFASGAYKVEDARELAFSLGITTKQGKKKSWQPVKDMLRNPIYAGYVRSDYTGGKMHKGIHEPLISEAIYYRNQAILDGNVKNFSRHAEEEWPLRGGFLSHTCGGAMSGSAPRGNSGPSPRYSCPACRASVIGAPVSKARGALHTDFMNLLDSIRPNESVVRLFKEVTLREWNNEMKEIRRLVAALNSELETLQEKRMRVLDLFIDGKLTESDKDKKLAEIDTQIAKLNLRLSELHDDIKDKESVIDSALLFMSNPALFWNLAPIELKRRIQDSIFPEGLVYDCATGFRTPKIAESYLLIKKIASEETKNPSLVAATGIEPVTSSL